MARHRARALFQWLRRNGTGALEPVPNPVATLYEENDTGTPLAVSVYATPTSTTPLTIPVTGDTDGNVLVYLDQGQNITATATASGLSVGTLTVEAHWNQSDIVTSLPWVDPTDPVYGAKFDAQRVNDAAMTSGSPYVDSATAFFTALDVGKWMDVENAGDVGTHGGHVHQRINARISATRVQLDGNAGRTVSGALAQWGTDDAAAINAALDDLRTAGRGVLSLPSGNTILQASADIRSLSSFALEGTGRGHTSLWAGAGLDGGGGDQNLRCSLLNGINFTATPGGTGPDGNTIQVGDETKYYRNVAVRKVTIDCSFQSVTGVTPGSSGGFNSSAIECQDISDGTVEDAEIVGAWGNGVVFGTIDPGQSTALKHALLRNVVFSNCVRGLLPTYQSVTNPSGSVGSVTQFGAANAARMENVSFFNSGGPIASIFNADNLSGDNVYNEGWNGAPCGPSQFGTIGAIQSDFGASRLRISNYTSKDAGGFYLTGQMSDQFFFNDYTPTPGPQECSFDNVSLIGTARKSVTAPGLTSGVSTAATTGFPSAVELTIPSGATVTVEVRTGADAAYATLVTARTTPGTFRFVVPIGYRARVTWTGSPAPTWAWWQAPNAQTAAIVLIAGSISGHPAVCQRNTFRSVRIQQPPAEGVRFYDCWWNKLDGVTVEDAGYWDGTQAFGLAYYSAFSLCSNNDVSRFDVIDNQPFATMRLKASIYEDASNAGGTNNTIEGSRLANGINGALVMTGSNVPGVLAVATPSLPGASTPLTNPFTHNCLVKVTGATNVAVDGTFRGIGTGWISLPQGSAISYTGSPSWLWYRA